MFIKAFSTSGPGGFKTLYLKMLIISSVYVLLAAIGLGGLIGLVVMSIAYKAVFDAGWVQALIIGIVGGTLGWGLFIVILVGLQRMGMTL